jgi:hypothetical protein
VGTTASPIHSSLPLTFFRFAGLEGFAAGFVERFAGFAFRAGLRTGFFLGFAAGRFLGLETLRAGLRGEGFLGLPPGDFGDFGLDGAEGFAGFFRRRAGFTGFPGLGVFFLGAGRPFEVAARVSISGAASAPLATTRERVVAPVVGRAVDLDMAGENQSIRIEKPSFDPDVAVGKRIAQLMHQFQFGPGCRA